MNKVAGYAIAAICLTASSHLATVQAKTWSSETSQVGASVHTALSALNIVAKRDKLGEIQIQDGQTLTKSALNLATGKIDIATIPTAVHFFFSQGIGPYAKLGKEKSAPLAANLRALFGIEAGKFVPLAFMDSGITSWQEFKGKKIFVGPPSGAAARNMIDFIEAVTGYKPGQDYKEIRVDWAASQQAMLDRKIDVYMRPATEPSPLVQQIASAGDIRVFGVPSDVVGSERWSKLVGQVGLEQGTHGTNAYEKGVEYVNAGPDGTLTTLTYSMYMGVNKDMPDEEAYRLVKAVFNHKATFLKSAAFMPSLRIHEGVVGLASVPGLKLHPGAAKALKEQGIEIPAKLM